MTVRNEKPIYACLNYGEVFCPDGIADRPICLAEDIGAALTRIA